MNLFRKKKKIEPYFVKPFEYKRNESTFNYDMVYENKILGIKGNHDNMDQFDNFPDIIDINNNLINIKGVKIIGIEGSIKYKGFDYPSFTQEESLELCNNLEKDADILITHAHLFDKNEKVSQYDCHIGLTGSTKYFLDNRCFLNIHGHDHSQLPIT